MALGIPDTFYLLVHDFAGGYDGKPATEESPLLASREDAASALIEALSTWPKAAWRIFHVRNCIMVDVSTGFADELDAIEQERERAARAEDSPYRDPNDEHRLTMAELGVGRFR